MKSIQQLSSSFALIVCLFLRMGHALPSIRHTVPQRQQHQQQYQRNTDLTFRSETFVSTTITTAANSNILSLPRGGADLNLDHKRHGFYLQTLAAYGTVTALVMNASLALYTATKFPTRSDKKKDHFSSSFMKTHISTIFTATTSLCVISGAFTVILFNILGIYTKSALGMGNEEGYLAFRAATHVYTKWGFRSFLTTLSSFVGALLMSVYNKIILMDIDDADDGVATSLVVKQLVFGGGVCVALFAGYHIKQVLNLATKLIFTPEFMTAVGE